MGQSHTHSPAHVGAQHEALAEHLASKVRHGTQRARSECAGQTTSRILDSCNTGVLATLVVRDAVGHST